MKVDHNAENGTLNLVAEDLGDEFLLQLIVNDTYSRGEPLLDGASSVDSVVVQSTVVGDETFYETTPGLTLRDHFASLAPQYVVDTICGDSHAAAREFIGLADDVPYNYSLHYPIVDAKARYIYADVMLKARSAR